MSTVITPSTPAPTSVSKPPSSLRKKRPPPLEPAHLISPPAVRSALHIGRKYARREVKKGEEHVVLDSFLNRMQKWMQEVAPRKMTVAEFVVDALNMGGKKDVKAVLADVRLAEFRQVTGGWEQFVNRKKGMDEVEGREETEDESTRDDAGVEGDANQGDSNESIAKESRDDTGIDQSVLDRIERNRRLALEKRKRALQVDREDVVERGEKEQEDIDMLVLDEMEMDQEDETASKERKKEKDDGTQDSALGAASGLAADKVGVDPRKQSADGKHAEHEKDATSDMNKVTNGSDVEKVEQPSDTLGLTQIHSADACSTQPVSMGMSTQQATQKSSQQSLSLEETAALDKEAEKATAENDSKIVSALRNQTERADGCESNQTRNNADGGNLPKQQDIDAQILAEFAADDEY